MAEWGGFGAIDLSDVQGSVSILNNGKYIVRCVEAKVEPTKAGNNRKLVIQLSEVNGLGEIRANMNIFHSNKDAQEIGLRQLKSFLTAASHPNPDKPGDVETMKSLEVGIIVGEGKSYTNQDGRRVTPSEVKKFFPVEQFDKIQVKVGVANAQAAHDRAMGPAASKDLDDDIPF